ncbi:MAG TPA: hypothetical protein VIK89_12140 [Cytophagaceae bacterium]
MKTKQLLFPILALLILLSSCSEEKKRKRIDINEIKPSLNLSAEVEEKFDAIVKKYDEKREAIRNTEGVDRATRMAQSRELMKQQNEEILAILNSEQQAIYKEFAKKFVRGRSGYSEELIERIKTELALDEQQSKMLIAVNNAFEKSYVNAHDYYHGNSEAAREYWNKFDEERKNALKQVFSEEQYAKYLSIVEHVGFNGEHGDAEKKQAK